jgi:hypothetical protein
VTDSGKPGGIVPEIDPKLGERFARAFMRQEWSSVSALLQDDIAFQGVTPAQVWEASSAGDLMDRVFAQWREPVDDIYEVISIVADRVGDRNKVVYRFRIRKPTGDYICEETAYYDAVDGKISRL